jgi:hypothetical protein
MLNINQSQIIFENDGYRIWVWCNHKYNDFLQVIRWEETEEIQYYTIFQTAQFENALRVIKNSNYEILKGRYILESVIGVDS